MRFNSAPNSVPTCANIYHMLILYPALDRYLNIDGENAQDMQGKFYSKPSKAKHN